MEDVQVIIRKYIQRWLDQRSSRSLSLLSKLTDIEYSTLRRIYRGETSIQLYHVLPLCERVCEYEETKSIISEMYPQLESLFVFMKDNTVPVKIIDLLRQEMYHLPIILASSHNGISEQEVKDLLGEQGSLAINELVKLEVLSRTSEGRIIVSNQKHLMLYNNAIVKKILLTLLQSVDTDKIALANRGTLKLASESFKPEVVRELNEDLVALGDKILSYMNDPKKHGDVRWYGGLFSSQFQLCEDK